jgi:hypothetical protein
VCLLRRTDRSILGSQYVERLRVRNSPPPHPDIRSLARTDVITNPMFYAVSKQTFLTAFYRQLRRTVRPIVSRHKIFTRQLCEEVEACSSCRSANGPTLRNQVVLSVSVTHLPSSCFTYQLYIITNRRTTVHCYMFRLTSVAVSRESLFTDVRSVR